MTSRQFKLQKVLDSKIHDQKQTQLRLYENLGKQQKKQDELQGLKNKYQMIAEKLQDEVADGTAAGRAKLLSLLCGGFSQKIKIVDQNVKNLKNEEKEIRAALKKKTKEKKILEKLKEKTLELQKVDEDKKEQRQLDDFVTRKIVIKDI